MEASQIFERDPLMLHLEIEVRAQQEPLEAIVAVTRLISWEMTKTGVLYRVERLDRRGSVIKLGESSRVEVVELIEPAIRDLDPED